MAGARGADHLDDLAARRAAHQRVVDHHDAFVAQHVGLRVELDLDPEVPNRRLRLDEGAADVVVADQPHLERQACGFGIPQRRGDARVGDRDHHVRGGRRFLCELAAERLARPIDVLPEHGAVGPGEIDVLEDAARRGGARKRHGGGQAALVEQQDLTGFHLALVRGPDQVQGAGLRRHHVPEAAGGFDAPQHQRAEAVRVARCDQMIFAQEHQRVGAAHLAQRVDDAVDRRGGARGRDQMQNDLGIDGGLEDRAARLQLDAKLFGIDQVAVVRDRERTVGVFGEQRLSVLQHGRAGGRVAVVADGARPFQPADQFLVENIGDQPRAFVGQQGPTVGGGDPGRLLAAVLERIERQIGEIGGFGVAVHADDAAFFMEAVEAPLSHARPFDRGVRHALPPDAVKARASAVRQRSRSVPTGCFR